MKPIVMLIVKSISKEISHYKKETGNHISKGKIILESSWESRLIWICSNATLNDSGDYNTGYNDYFTFHQHAKSLDDDVSEIKAFYKMLLLIK